MNDEFKNIQERTSGTSSGGLGLCGTLGVVFIVLKLVDVIGWPWFWVVCPFWMPLALLLFLALFFAILGGVRESRRIKIEQRAADEAICRAEIRRSRLRVEEPGPVERFGQEYPCEPRDRQGIVFR